MSTIGKNLSFVKRKLAQERTPNVISRTVVYMHQATGYSTLIDLNSLNLPSEAAANGFANPGLDNIPFLVLFRQNVKIESSYKGELVDYQDYIITNNTQINLLSPNTTEPGEVFVITLNLPNNVDVKSLLDNLNTPLFSLNQALYGVNSLLKFSASNLGTQVLSILDYVANKNKEEQQNSNQTSEFVTALTGGSGAFVGGVLLPDGRVFCVPYNASNAKIYDPVTNTQSTTALTGGSGAFSGGVLLPDGRVFCVPFNASNARIYNPADNTQTTVNLTGGSNAFVGGVLLPDGRVFCVPLNASNARIYNPADNTQTTVNLTGGSQAFNGGVLLPDGRVFCVPRNASNARIYNPADNTQTTVNLTTDGVSYSFYSGVLLPDGRVFCVPLSASNAKIYNPADNTQTTVNLTTGVSFAFTGGVLLPDGRVFCVPLNASNAKIYDPVTNTQSTTPLTGGTNALEGGVLLPDGRVFCVPHNASNAKILSGSFSRTTNRFQFPINLLLSSFLNKL